MKRLWICFLLLALLFALLLAGCGIFGEDETEEIPNDSYQMDPAWTQGNNVSPEPTGKTTVKTVRSYDGEIPLSQPVKSYSYRLPFIDLAGAQAVGCNQEIENLYGTLIRQSLDAMERYEDPILQRLSFTSYSFGGVLTVRVDRLDYDGNSTQAYYTVDAENGEAVSLEKLFAAANVDGDPQTVINDAVIALFTSRFGDLKGAGVEVTTALNRTQGALSSLSTNRFYMTETGALRIALELYAPDGSCTLEELSLP